MHHTMHVLDAPDSYYNKPVPRAVNEQLPTTINEQIPTAVIEQV